MRLLPPHKGCSLECSSKLLCEALDSLFGDLDLIERQFVEQLEQTKRRDDGPMFA